MKLKLNKMHIIGLSAFIVGIGVLIFGLVILFKCINIKDISKLKHIFRIHLLLINGGMKIT